MPGIGATKGRAPAALTLARAGANIVLNGHRDAGLLEAVAERVRGALDGMAVDVDGQMGKLTGHARETMQREYDRLLRELNRLYTMNHAEDRFVLVNSEFVAE